MLQFWISFLIEIVSLSMVHNTGFGKGLLAKQIASIFYKLSGTKTEEPISLKWKMGLNENATTHLADKEIVISTNIATGHPKTVSDTVTSRTSTRTKATYHKTK